MSNLIEPLVSAKSATAFKTISEVSQETGVPQHVLRFWEGKFSQLRPLKRGGGRRYYRPEDVALLQRIRRLLQEEGYTIKGVQKVLREHRSLLEDAPKMVRPAPDVFPRTRAAFAAQQPEDEHRPLVLDVQAIKRAGSPARLIEELLEQLRDLRATLDD